MCRAYARRGCDLFRWRALHCDLRAAPQRGTEGRTARARKTGIDDLLPSTMIRFTRDEPKPPERLLRVDLRPTTIRPSSAGRGRIQRAPYAVSERARCAPNQCVSRCCSLGVASCRIVQNNPGSVAEAGPQMANSTLQVHSVHTSRAMNRSMTGRNHCGISLM